MAILPTLVETRSSAKGDPGVMSDFWYDAIPGMQTKAGTRVNATTAMTYLTVARCVMLISADLARLPLILYKRFPDGSKEQQVDHPLYDILKNSANPETPSYNWRETGEGHCLLQGNHFSVIQRNKFGTIQALWQIASPEKVRVRRDDKGRIFYEWWGRIYSSGKTTTTGDNIDLINPGGSLTQIRKFQDEMFHVPGFGFNGLYGLSNLQIMRESVGLGLANDEFASRYFGQGMHIGGTVTLPEGCDLGTSEEEYKKTLKKEFGGLQSSHGVMVFANGETYTQFKMPLKDAQFLESRRFQKTEIAGFYGVPPHKVGVHEKSTNRSNLEQENQNYVDGCLIHWLTRWETAISHQLLTKAERKEGLFAEFNVLGLLRGDSAARAEYYNKLFQIAGIKPNEIRAHENKNPIEGGDQSFVMLNLIPLDKAGELQEQQARSDAWQQGEFYRLLLEEKRQQLQQNDSIKTIEHRSILARERISRQYHPLLLRAADKIVNLEATAITRNAEKFRKQRAKPDMEAWLQDFYRNVMPEKIVREIGPVFQSFSEAIQKESIAEIGADPEKVNLDSFTDDYIKAYAGRHSSSSIGQMNEQLAEDTGEGESPLVTRANEWEERRPEKIANNETVRMANAVFQAVVFSVGLSTVWRARGAKTCPYCMELNGRRVASGQSFVADGSELNPEGGTGPMKIRGLKAHPPLHLGCDCYLSAG